MDGMHGWTFDERKAPFCIGAGTPRSYGPSVNAFLKHFAEGAVVGAVVGKGFSRAEDLTEFWADLSTLTKSDSGLFSSRKYA